MSLTREEMIAKLEWNEGGYGFGICSVAGSAIWGMDRPGPGKRDLKSIVAIGVPASKYSDEELVRIVDFADKITVDYDKLFSIRRGANMVLLNKEDDGRWLRKRLSWISGAMFSDTFDDALSFMKS